MTRNPPIRTLNPYAGAREPPNRSARGSGGTGPGRSSRPAPRRARRHGHRRGRGDGRGRTTVRPRRLLAHARRRVHPRPPHDPGARSVLVDGRRAAVASRLVAVRRAGGDVAPRGRHGRRLARESRRRRGAHHGVFTRGRGGAAPRRGRRSGSRAPRSVWWARGSPNAPRCSATSRSCSRWSWRNAR